METDKFLLNRFSDSLYSIWNLILGILIIYLISRSRQIYLIVKMLPRDLRLLRGFFFILFGAASVYLRRDTIISLFKRLVKKNPKKVIFYFEDQKWTAEDLDVYSNKIASVFHKQGYKKGDVVALLSYNCIEYIGIWLGLAKIGVVSALINTNLRLQPLAHCVNVAKCKGFIFTSDFSKALNDIKNLLPMDLEYFEYGPGTDLTKLLETAKGTPIEPNERLTDDDKLMYIYTSGTTGLPKAAVVAHRRSTFIACGLKNLLGLYDSDILYNPLPLYHTAGGIMGTLPALVHGIPSVIRLKFSARAYFPDCVKYKCTVGQYIGEICRYVLSTPPSAADTQHIVRVIAGNGLKADVWRQFVDRFKISKVIEFYGSTEGNTNVVNSDNKIGAVGYFPMFIPISLLPLSIIKYNELTCEPVRDKNGLCIRCKTGEPGMAVGVISHIDPTRKFDGYVDQKETNRKVIHNVFKHGDAAYLSGDILVMDECRYLYFRDRTGDTFRWKGENVSTGEVEAVISNLIDNKDCTVYGVQVGNLEGRAGMAAIVDPNSEIVLEKLCKGIDKSLPSYAMPLFLRIVPELEFTGTYKVKKTKFQEENFNPDFVKDKLYFKDPVQGFIPLTKDVYNEIINGSRKV